MKKPIILAAASLSMTNAFMVPQNGRHASVEVHSSAMAWAPEPWVPAAGGGGMVMPWDSPSYARSSESAAAKEPMVETQVPNNLPSYFQNSPPPAVVAEEVPAAPSFDAPSSTFSASSSSSSYTTTEAPAYSSYIPEDMSDAASSMPWNVPSYVRDSTSAVKKSMIKKPMTGSSTDSVDSAMPWNAPSYIRSDTLKEATAYAATAVVSDVPETTASESVTTVFSYTMSESTSTASMPWNKPSYVRDESSAVKKSLLKKMKVEKTNGFGGFFKIFSRIFRAFAVMFRGRAKKGLPSRA